MQIPEYTQRIIGDSTPTTKINISEPEVFTNTSALSHTVGTISKTAKEMGDVYFDMKKQRDQGIANEFMNQFTIDKATWIRENKEKYKGARAEGIIDAYNEWQSNYLSSRMGFSQDNDDNTLYLENEEQIEFVKDQLGRDLANSVNTLSSYAASELDTYKNNQMEARMSLIAEDIAGESDLNNIANDINNIAYNMRTRYEGQSPEFIELQTKKLINSSLKSNVSNNLMTNPTQSMLKLQNKMFLDNMDSDTISTLKENAIKSYIDYEADNISNALLSGQEVNDILDIKGWNDSLPIIKEFGEETVRREILEKAGLLSAKKSKENQAATSNINNDATISLFRSLDIKDNINTTPEQRVQAMEDISSAVEKLGLSSEGQKIAKFISDMNEKAVYWVETDKHRPDIINAIEMSKADLIAKEFASNKTNEERFKAVAKIEKEFDNKIAEINEKATEDENKIENEQEQVSRYIEQINKHGYYDLNSLINSGLDKLHPVNQEEVVREFVNSLAFDKVAQAYKGKGTSDIESKMRTMFKSISGTSADDNPYGFSVYRNQMKDYLLAAYSMGEDVKKVMPYYSSQAYYKLMSEDPVSTELYRISLTMPKSRTDIKKTYGQVVTSELLSDVKKELEDSDIFGNMTENEINRLASMLIHGDSTAAAYLAKYIYNRKRS